MLKTTSANRPTKLKVIEEGKVVKTISNASINYGQNLDQLKKMIELAIRLSPQDPVYNVDKLSINLEEGKDVDIDQNELEMIQNSLFKQDSLVILGNKVNLTVHVKKPVNNSRSVSRGPVRMENQENSNRYENIMRPPSPMSKRSSTPGKGRSVSRSRGAPGPSSTPSRDSRDSRMLSNITPLRARERMESTPARTPAREISAPVVPRPTPVAPTASIAPESSDAQSQEVAVRSVEPVNTPSMSAKKLRRQSIVEIEEEKKKIETTISQTWVEVGGSESVTPPSKSYLGAFSYYSPIEEQEEEENEDIPLVSETPVEAVKPEASLFEGSTDSQEPQEQAKEAQVGEQPEEQSEDQAKADEEDSQSISQSSTNIRTTPKKLKSVNSKSNVKNYMTPTASRPVYPEGRTLAESSVCYEHSLRSYGGKSQEMHSAKKKAHLHGAGSGAGTKENELSPFRNLLSASKSKDSEGRPSIGTITTQWEFMRTNFLNNSDEELEWLMVSKKPGAYKYAHRKNEQAEDKYFKSLYETELFETKLKSFLGFNAKLPNLLNEMAGLYSVLMANPKDETSCTTAAALHQKITDYLKTNEPSQLFIAFTNATRLETSLLAMMKEEDKYKMVRKSRDLSQLLNTEVVSLQNKLTQARKDSDESLKNMEKWSKRETEVDEYPSVMKKQEEEWMQIEFEENSKALFTMRSFLPPTLLEMSVADIQNSYLANESYISLELAQEIKTNKLLHWLITHPEDIAFSNFLTGDSKSFFENLESLDLIEMRAIALVLPSKFELDNDGKKQDWRNRFFNRLKQLVSQQHQEKVKGMWDPAANVRTQVNLPPLKPDQIRKPIYYYRTKEQSDVKLKQYDDKLALLQKKKDLLEKAEKDAKESKEEYDTILKEMRDPDFIELYGPEKLASAKELAKNEWNNCEKKRKTLSQEVDRLKKSIESAPLTREQFLEKENQLQEFLSRKDIDWTEKGLAPILTEGVFDGDRVPEKRIKAAAKFQSAEQEALERKNELTALKSRQPFAPEPVTPAPQALPTPQASQAPQEDVVVVVEISEPGIEIPSCASASMDPLATSQPLNDIDLLSESFDLSMSLNSSTTNNFQTPKPKRRNTVLANCNPELLNTLNKMLSSPVAGGTPIVRAKTPARRASILGTVSVDTTETSKADPNAPKEIKISKSKLLKKLLGEGEEAPKEDTSAPRPGLSFLDQLKARSGGDGATPAKPLSFLDQLKARNGGGDSATPAKPLSFLEQIKARNGGGESSAPANDAPLSFLDQIKASKKSQEENASTGASESLPAPPAPKPTLQMPMRPTMFGGAEEGGMSFLEQIKARRKTTEE